MNIYNRTFSAGQLAIWARNGWISCPICVLAALWAWNCHFLCPFWIWHIQVLVLGQVGHLFCRPGRGWNLFRRLPFAADWRHDGAFLFEHLHCLIHILAVQAAQFCDLTCIKRLSSLFHCSQYFFFVFHIQSILCLWVQYTNKIPYFVSIPTIMSNIQNIHIRIAFGPGGSIFSPPGPECVPINQIQWK